MERIKSNYVVIVDTYLFKKLGGDLRGFVI